MESGMGGLCWSLKDCRVSARVDGVHHLWPIHERSQVCFETSCRSICALQRMLKVTGMINEHRKGKRGRGSSREDGLESRRGQGR